MSPDEIADLVTWQAGHMEFVGIALFAGVCLWMLVDATRRPAQWARLWKEGPWLKAQAWVAGLGVAVTAGLAAGGASADELGTVAVVTLPVLFIAHKFWFEARINRWSGQ